MNKVEWSVSQIFHTNLYWRIATIKVQNWHRRCTLIDFPKAFIIGFQPVVMDKCSQLFMDGLSILCYGWRNCIHKQYMNFLHLDIMCCFYEQLLPYFIEMLNIMKRNSQIVSFGVGKGFNYQYG